MKYLLVPLLLIICLPLFAQHQSIKNFHKKYMEYENVTNVSLSGWVLKMAAEYADESKEKEMLEKISKIRIMVMDDENLVTKSDYKHFLKEIKKDNFELLMNLNEGGKKIDFHLREDALGFITDVLLLVNNQDEFVMVNIEGLLKYSDLNDLQFNMQGSDYFKKLPEKRKAIPRA